MKKHLFLIYTGKILMSEKFMYDFLKLLGNKGLKETLKELSITKSEYQEIHKSLNEYGFLE